VPPACESSEEAFLSAPFCGVLGGEGEGVSTLPKSMRTGEFIPTGIALGSEGDAAGALALLAWCDVEGLLIIVDTAAGGAPVTNF